MLQIDPELPVEEIKKKYKRVSSKIKNVYYLFIYLFLIFFPMNIYIGNAVMQLSILVHPDKNTEDSDRAQQAFEGRGITNLISSLVRDITQHLFPYSHKQSMENFRK